MEEVLLDGSEKLRIFAGTSHFSFTESVAGHIGAKVSQAVVGRFNNGEIQVMIGDNVRGKDVFAIQTMGQPVNESIVELLVMIDAFKRSSARTITAVIPYYAYARQDHQDRDREPIAAKVVANLLMTAGADRVVTMDLHSGQIEGFFDIPVDHLLAAPLLTAHLKERLCEWCHDFVVVSPDMGGVNRARRIAERLDCPMVIIDKRRPARDVAVVANIVGNVKGKTAILVDDTVDTAGSLVEGAKALKEAGAREIYACCTHAVLSGNAVELLEQSALREIIVTDTIPLSKEKQSSKIQVVTVAPLFGEAILRIFNEQSVSKLFT